MSIHESTWSDLGAHVIMIYLQHRVSFVAPVSSLSHTVSHICPFFVSPSPVFVHVLNFSPLSSCLPYSSLLSIALFGSVFGLWQPRGSLTVFSTQSAVSFLPGPDPAILSTRTLSVSFILFPSIPPSLHHPCLHPCPSCPPPFSLWPLSAVQPTAMAVRDTDTQRHITSAPSLLLLPSLLPSASAVWVESVGQ